MYKHEFRFNRINQTIETEEPFGFDKAKFTLKQERHTRSLIIADFDEVEVLRGTHACFELLALEIQNYGVETDVDYILSIDNVPFKIGQIDGLTSHIFKDKIKIQITQNSLHTYIKRNENVEIDAFNDKDLKGNPITPCQTVNVWAKPKPINQRSEWGSKSLGDSGFLFFFSVMPIVNNLFNFGLENSFSPFDLLLNNASNVNEVNNANRLFTAKNTLENVKIKIKNINLINFRNGGISLKLLRYTDIATPLQTIDLIPFELISSSGQNFALNTEISIPLINAGESVLINFNFLGGRFDSYSCEGVEITATSIAIGSVVKMIRLKDWIKHKVESMGAVCNDTVFNTPLYNDNFVANGRMIGGLDDLPFHTPFKKALETFTSEAFADYEITDTNVNIQSVNDCYMNEESEVLEIAPEHLYSLKVNEILTLNTIEIGFKKSSKERTGNAQNTIDAIHTDIQLKYETERADATKKIDFDHIRGHFLFEEQRRKNNEIEESTKTLENDENIFAMDCIPTPPNFTNSFTRFVRVQVEVPSQIMTILSDGTFKWTNLGMVVGQTIQEGGTELQITEITDYQLKAYRINNHFSETATFEFSTTFTYTLQGIPYIIRTNEGFAEINGIENPENYANLNFSLKRIFNRHLDWWLNAGQFLIGKKINVTKISINDKLQTRLNSETNLIVDKDSIDIVNGGFMSGFVLNAKVFSDFETCLNIVSNRNKFITVQLPNDVYLSGWIKDFQYNWRTNTAMIDIELTKESLEIGYPYIFNVEL